MSVELGQRLSARWAMAQHLLRSRVLLLPNRLLKNSSALGCEGSVVAIVERQLDLEGAVVLKFGGGVA
jgi:hypothetical protein